MLTTSENTITLFGAVDLKTATSLNDKGIAFIINTSEKFIIVDLSQITEGDSIALALMLSWKRLAEKKGIQIKFEGWPEILMRLAKLCGVDCILTSM